MRNYWYFTEYFCLYLFIPIVNKGILYLNKLEIKIVIRNLLFFFIILKNVIYPNSLNLQYGYSFSWLLILYIVGAYFGLFIINNHKRSVIFYFINISIFISSTLLSYFFKTYRGINLKIIKNLFRIQYNSLPMILQAFSLILLIVEIKSNKIFKNLIIFSGSHTFGVYLIHDNNLIRTYFIKNLFNKYPKSLSFSNIIFLIHIKGITIFIICILIDFLRYKLFNIVKIRNLCIFIDQKINNI